MEDLVSRVMAHVPVLPSHSDRVQLALQEAFTQPRHVANTKINTRYLSRTLANVDAHNRWNLEDVAWRQRRAELQQAQETRIDGQPRAVSTDTRHERSYWAAQKAKLVADETDKLDAHSTIPISAHLQSAPPPLHNMRVNRDSRSPLSRMSDESKHNDATRRRHRRRRRHSVSTHSSSSRSHVHRHRKSRRHSRRHSSSQ